MARDERDVRGAIDRLAKRFKEGSERSGVPMPIEQAKEKARKVARRNEED